VLLMQYGLVLRAVFRSIWRVIIAVKFAGCSTRYRFLFVRGMVCSVPYILVEALVITEKFDIYIHTVSGI
jgi:hypothetical protein